MRKLDRIKELLIKEYKLNKHSRTRNNDIYEGEDLVMIQSSITGEIKIKFKRYDKY